MRKHTNYLARILLGCMMLLCCAVGYAQQVQFKGLVVDQEGNPLIGATVIVKGDKRQNTITDLSGEFRLQNLAEGATLQISYIGFRTEEVKIGKESFAKVILKEDEAVLNEVVVVGYGTQKKQTLTGAISTLSGETVLTTKSTSVAQSLQGKIAGVQIRQQDGQPGGFSSMVQIRGFGSPLYVIDGVVRDSGDGGSEFQRRIRKILRVYRYLKTVQLLFMV